MEITLSRAFMEIERGFNSEERKREKDDGWRQDKAIGLKMRE